MKPPQQWRRLLGSIILAASATAVGGCLKPYYPVPPPAHELMQPCQALPDGCRNQVYIFLINGLDPVNLANMTGVRDHLQKLGFHKTYYGQLYHASYFEKEIRRIHHEDPEARFVLLGFSFGANLARNISHHVKNDGIDIDLLVYCGGNTFDNIPGDRPENAHRIVNILASGCIWNGAWLDGAENVHAVDVFHFGTPSHPRTLEILDRELAVVATAVPILHGVETIPGPDPEEMPAPRPAKPQGAARRDEWDFLQPQNPLALSTRQVGAQPPRASLATSPGRIPYTSYLLQRD
jgi:hypothetical protein